MRHTKLELYVNPLLEVDRFRDYCPNGLQVEGQRDIRKLATGVTASRALLEAALAWGADAALVHHGFFWKMSLCRSAAGNISVFAYCWRMACTCLPTICRSMRIQSSAITRSLGNGWACARKAVLAIRNWDGLEPCLSQSRSRPSRRR